MTLGALSKSGMEGVEPKFFQPVPALTVPQSASLLGVGEGSFPFGGVGLFPHVCL